MNTCIYQYEECWSKCYEAEYTAPEAHLSAAVRAIGRRWDPYHVDTLGHWASDVIAKRSGHSAMSCGETDSSHTSVIEYDCGK